MTMLPPGTTPLDYTLFGPHEAAMAVALGHPMNWEPGDVLLIHRRRWDLINWFIGLITRSRWSSVGIYLGEGKYIEAGWFGVRVSQFSENFMTDVDEDPHRVIEVRAVRVVGMFTDAKQRDEVLAYAAGFLFSHVPRVGAKFVADVLAYLGFEFDKMPTSAGDLAEVFGVPR